jgi:hypothetical protein
MSADLIAHRMRSLACPEILADVFEINPPPHFDAERWADAARDIAQNLAAGKAITAEPMHIVLLVESLEGNSVIGKTPQNRRAGMIEIANVAASRLEPYIGRPVRPEVL